MMVPRRSSALGGSCVALSLRRVSDVIPASAGKKSPPTEAKRTSVERLPWGRPGRAAMVSSQLMAPAATKDCARNIRTTGEQHRKDSTFRMVKIFCKMARFECRCNYTAERATARPRPAHSGAAPGTRGDRIGRDGPDQHAEFNW